VGVPLTMADAAATPADGLADAPAASAMVSGTPTSSATGDRESDEQARWDAIGTNLGILSDRSDRADPIPVLSSGSRDRVGEDLALEPMSDADFLAALRQAAESDEPLGTWEGPPLTAAVPAVPPEAASATGPGSGSGSALASENAAEHPPEPSPEDDAKSRFGVRRRR